MKHHVVSYTIFGVKLYAVESSDGYVHRYCDTRERAQELVDKLDA